MGFYVVDGPVYERWAPVDGTDTLYVGQLVGATSDGVLPLGTSVSRANHVDGICTENTRDAIQPYGIVAGTNRTDDLFDATYSVNSVIGVAAIAGQTAIGKSLTEGQLGATGDIQSKVLVQCITPSTIIRGTLNDASYGTAPTVSTVTVASSDGGATAVTASAAGAASFLADMSTIYCRTGANSGIYRNGINTANTAQQCTHAMPAAIAVGDTLVQVPVAMNGFSYINFDSESMFVDSNVIYDTSSADSGNYHVTILEVNLREAGKEYVDFMFTAQNWVSLYAAT